MGLLDRPSAPERWGSSVVSFTAARLSHEMTWPKVNLASRNSGAGVLFALCVLCPPPPFFFHFWSCHRAEELYQPFLPAEERRKKISLLMFSTLSSYLFLCRSRFSFILLLSASAGQKQKKWKKKNKKPKHKHFSVSSEKHTYTRHSPQLAAPGCGRRGLCDGGRPAGHALNTPTVLQRRGAGKGEAWENTEASKQQPVTRPTTHTLHYCPDTITMHKGGKSPSGRAPEHSQKKSHCKKKYNNNNKC